MALTIGDVVLSARAILQDTTTPFRYSNADLYRIFTTAVSEARRLRPDLFVATMFADLPAYTADDKEDAFPVWEGYQVAFVNFIVGRAMLRDDQFGEDPRASQLLAAFKAQLSTTQA